VLAVILTALGHVPTPLVIAVAVAAGLVNPAIAGGWTSQVPQVLGGRDLGRASNWDAMTFSVASLPGWPPRWRTRPSRWPSRSPWSSPRSRWPGRFRRERRRKQH
jgi:hypothetical protein